MKSARVKKRLANLSHYCIFIVSFYFRGVKLLEPSCCFCSLFLTNRRLACKTLLSCLIVLSAHVNVT